MHMLTHSCTGQYLDTEAIARTKSQKYQAHLNSTTCCREAISIVESRARELHSTIDKVYIIYDSTFVLAPSVRIIQALTASNCVPGCPAILAAWNMKVVYFRAQLMLQVSSVDCSSLV